MSRVASGDSIPPIPTSPVKLPVVKLPAAGVVPPITILSIVEIDITPLEFKLNPLSAATHIVPLLFGKVIVLSLVVIDSIFIFNLKVSSFLLREIKG